MPTHTHTHTYFKVCRYFELRLLVEGNEIETKQKAYRNLFLSLIEPFLHTCSEGTKGPGVSSLQQNDDEVQEENEDRCVLSSSSSLFWFAYSLCRAGGDEAGKLRETERKYEVWAGIILVKKRGGKVSRHWDLKNLGPARRLFPDLWPSVSVTKNDAENDVSKQPQNSSLANHFYPSRVHKSPYAVFSYLHLSPQF